MREKFSESDRRRVVAFLEREHGVRLRLRRRGGSRKVLEDDAGRPYFVLGAHGDWHGVRAEDLDAAAYEEGVLAVALVRGDAIDVYVGPLRRLAERRRSLSATADGCYHFHTVRGAGRVTVKEAPSLALTFMGRVGLGDFAGAGRSPRRPATPQERILKGFEQLSEEGQRRLLERLRRRLDVGGAA